MEAKIAFVLCALFITVWAEVINVEECASAAHCRISEVRITPCPQTKMCRLKKLSTVSISFDFIPDFTASKLNTSVSYMGISFPSLDIDACKYTTCPSELGKTQQFNFNLYIAKSIPTGRFPVEWKVWNGDDASQTCCFQTYLKIVK